MFTRLSQTDASVIPGFTKLRRRFRTARLCGRAKLKIAAYDRAAQQPDIWSSLWGLDAMPKVLMVWRYAEVQRDYRLRLRGMERERTETYANAPYPKAEWLQLSLADVLGDLPLNILTF